MRHNAFMGRIVFLALVVGGCALAEAEPGQEYTLTVDAAYSVEDRAEIERALTEWRDFSDGLVNIRAVARDGDGSLHRSLKRGKFSCGNERRSLQIWSTRTGSELRACVKRGIGVLLGMRYDGATGVLGKTRDVDFTEDDRQACLEAGFCR
jgi:hypothetical protein